MNNIMTLNSTSIALMNAGAYRQALESLRDALTALHSQAVEEPGRDKNATTINKTDFSTREAGLMACEEGSFFVYKQAFIIDLSFADSSSAFCWKTAAVLLYNTGLAHHLLAMQDAYCQEQRLSKALIFYEIARDILDNASASESLLSLAIYNNMGAIHSHFLRSNEEQHSLEWMRYSLQVLDSFGQSDCCSDVTEFQLNIFLLYGKPPKPAPAA